MTEGEPIDRTAQFDSPQDSQFSQLPPKKQGVHDKQQGLYARYDVKRIDGKPLADGGAFVIEMDDPIGLYALRVYASLARASGYHQLADDLVSRVRIAERVHRKKMDALPVTLEEAALTGTVKETGDDLLILVEAVR